MLGVVVLKSSQGQASSCQLMFGTNRLCACTTRCLFPHSLCVCHTLLPHSLTHCPAFYHSILHLFHPSHFMLLHLVLSPRQPPTVISSLISRLINCTLKGNLMLVSLCCNFRCDTQKSVVLYILYIHVSLSFVIGNRNSLELNM